MAPARPQRHAVHAPNRHRAGAAPVYEDFKPDTEWKHEDQSDIFLIQLPGFAKEHLKVSMAESTATLRIRGERLVGVDRWSRFEEAVTIPKDCNRSSIRAKYEHGVLTITMPKTPKEDTLVVPHPGGPKQENNAKTTTTTTEQALPTPEQPSSDRKRTVDQQEAQSKKQKHEENARKSLADHFSSQQEEKATMTTSEPLAKSVDKGQEQPCVTQTQSSNATKTREMNGGKGSVDHKGEPEPIETLENVINNKRVKDKTEKTGGGGVDPTTDTKATEPENRTLTGGGDGASTTPAGIMNGFKFDKYMQAMKGKLANRTELNEERQLMVNVGTAVMVIVGLGAYLSYTAGLSG